MSPMSCVPLACFAADGAGGGSYKSRVKLVKDRFTRQVKFSTPQAEKSITGTVKLMRQLMEKPMVVDGEVVRDEVGEQVPRRRFWSVTQANDALDMIQPESLAQIQSLEELADVLYVAKFDLNVCHEIMTNEAFLRKVVSIRDFDNNSLLHWLAAADMPRKLLYGVLKGLRDLHESTADEALAKGIAETLKAENAKQVKLYEIAYALKDEGLAAELMRANVSPREKNKSGTTFVQEALQTETGSAYLEKMEEIAKVEKIETAVVKEVVVSEQDRREILLRKAAQDVITSFVRGDKQLWQKRLKEAKAEELVAMSLFFETNAEAAARARGQFHFGRLDRDGRDWLFPVIELGDLATVDEVMRLIERYARSIGEVFARAKSDVNVDDVQRQVMRAYLRTTTANGTTVMHHAINLKKSIILKRLVESGLYLPQHLTAERNPQKKAEMLQKNMQFLLGRNPKENLFLAASMVETRAPGVDEDSATTAIMKILEVLFEQLSDDQGAQLFTTPIKVGRPPNQGQVSLISFVMNNSQILPKVKDAFKLYAESYAA